MRIGEAIDILSALTDFLPQDSPYKSYQAVKLGIEALKYRRDLEEENSDIMLEPLPGETEE